MTFLPFLTRLQGGAGSRRWIGLLIASVVLHLVLLDWANGNIGLPSWPAQNAPIMTAQLQASEPPRPAVAPAPPPKPAPPSPKKPRQSAPRPAPVPPAALPTVAVETSPPSPADTTSAQEGLAVPGSSVEPAVETPLAQAPPVAEPVPAASAAPEVLPVPPQSEVPRYKISLPPSAELKYDVQALRDGKMVYGHGKFNWQTQGNNYTASGEAGILFFTVLNFKSQGDINEFGIAPLLYSEKGFRKSETNTHFHRERNTISFSASQASYPRKGGEQDRASVIWQLVGIGRGDGGKFAPGSEIDIFVAGVRDAETWNVRVIGQEDIAVGLGKMSAWHIARVPRAGSYDKKIDIWLAPQHEWYPVKVRYTEANGDYLDMSLSNIALTAARAPAERQNTQGPEY